MTPADRSPDAAAMPDGSAPWPCEAAAARRVPPAAAPHPPRDAFDLRHGLGRFATGVTIVTCRHGGRRVGLTVNSFASLSLQPPLVLWSLRLASPSLDAFSQVDHFAVNVLAEPALPLARRFAASAAADRFADGDWRDGADGAPVLGLGSVAVLECRRVGMHDGGDHRIFVGEVLALRTDDDAAPPLFRGGRYHALGDERS